MVAYFNYKYDCNYCSHAVIVIWCLNSSIDLDGLCLIVFSVFDKKSNIINKFFPVGYSEVLANDYELCKYTPLGLSAYLFKPLIDNFIHQGLFSLDMILCTERKEAWHLRCVHLKATFCIFM